MKITKIFIENYLGVGRFVTNRLGKLNKITGGNGTGKSSVLKAITEAFKSSGNDPNLIKVDTDKAEILIELDGNIEVRRRITESNNSVKVVHDGNPLEKPQTWLRTILSPYSFDPIEFFQAKPKERRQVLLSAMPVTLTPEFILEHNQTFSAKYLSKFDFTKHGLDALKDIQKEAYDRRHEIGIGRDRLKKAIAQDKRDMPEHIDKDKLGNFDLNEKVNEKAELKSAIDNHVLGKSRLLAMRDQAQSISDEIDRAKELIKNLENQLEQLNAKGVELKKGVDEFNEDETIGLLAAIDADISEYQQFQKLALRLEDIERKEKQYDEENDSWRKFDDFHKQLTGVIPRKLLSQIDLPIENIEIKHDTILVKGVDIDKLSDSEKMRFSIQVAKALSGELKIICVDRFETLDKDNRKIFEQEAKKDDFEYFMTIVTGGELGHEIVNNDSSSPSRKSGKPKEGSKPVAF